jgi:hypothetical protein
MLISLCGIYGRDGNRWSQNFNGAWQVLLELLTGRIIAKKKVKSQYLREAAIGGGRQSSLGDLAPERVRRGHLHGG